MIITANYGNNMIGVSGIGLNIGTLPLYSVKPFIFHHVNIKRLCLTIICSFDEL